MASAKTNAAYLQVAINLDLLPVSQLLEGTGLDLNSLTDTETVDTQVVVRVVNNLNQHCDKADWRTLFGGHIGMTGHGPVGFASLTAATIGEAIATFVRWEQVQSQTYSGKVSISDDWVSVELEDLTGDEVFAEFLFEAFVKAMEVLLVQLLGNLENNRITVHFKSSARQALLNQHLSAALFFGQSSNCLKVPLSLWQKTSPLANLEIHQLNVAKCRQMLERLSEVSEIDKVVGNILRQHFEDVLLQNSPSMLPPTLVAIAQQLHLTERTLIRKLKSKNTSYKQLLEQARQTQAKILLQRKDLSIAQIAELLGYRESANFCRAFKRWFGISATGYTNQ